MEKFACPATLTLRSGHRPTRPLRPATPSDANAAASVRAAARWANARPLVRPAILLPWTLKGFARVACYHALSAGFWRARRWNASADRGVVAQMPGWDLTPANSLLRSESRAHSRHYQSHPPRLSEPRIFSRLASRLRWYRQTRTAFKTSERYGDAEHAAAGAATRSRANCRRRGCRTTARGDPVCRNRRPPISRHHPFETAQNGATRQPLSHQSTCRAV